jgi:hypothetical protein
LLIAENAGAQAVRIGNRQQLFFCIDADQLEDLEMDMLRAEINYEINEDEYPTSSVPMLPMLFSILKAG